jgi:acyl-CoA thioester hydrolase
MARAPRSAVAERSSAPQVCGSCGTGAKPLFSGLNRLQAGAWGHPKVSSLADWDLPAPHIVTLIVAHGDIDEYQHVNNAVYVSWLDRAAWDHSAALGLPIARCLELDRGMAVLRSVITYHRPALRDDAVQVATWLLPGDGRLRVRRRFQVRRAHDGTTLARAEVEYGCIELSSGRPVRWPPEFRANYVPVAEVISRSAGLAPL